MNGKPFKISTDSMEKLFKGMNKEINRTSENLKSKTTAATNIVFKVATAKRPKISKEQYKASDNHYTRKTEKGRKKYYVSDPDASVGVPVDTGDLQISIKKEIINAAGKWQGIISTDSPYARAIEFGTSKMKARSFLRSALFEMSQTVRSIFNAKI